MARVLITGCFGHGAFFRDAGLSSLLSHLELAIEGLRPAVVSIDPIRTALGHGIDVVGWSERERISSLIAASRLMIIGGHDTFSAGVTRTGADGFAAESFGIHRFTEAAVLAAVHDVPLMISGVRIGQPTDDETAAHLRTLFELASAASVADENSLGVLTGLGIDTAGVELCADPGVCVGVDDEEGAKTRLEGWGLAPADRPPIGIVLYGWQPKNAEPTTAALASAVATFANANGVDILVISDTSSDSQAVERTLLHNLRQRIDGRHCVRRITGSSETCGFVSLAAQCSMLLVPAPQAGLVAIATGVPTVGLCEDPPSPDPAEADEQSSGRFVVEADPSREREFLAVMSQVWSGRIELVSMLLGLRHDAEAQRRASLQHAVSIAASLVQDTTPVSGGRIGSARMVCRTAHSLSSEGLFNPQVSELDTEQTVEETGLEEPPIPRGLLRRAVNWVFLPREEGRLLFWSRSVYFAAVRALGGILRPITKRPKDAATLATRFQYRFMRTKRIRNAIYGRTLRSFRCPSIEDLVSVVLPVHNGATTVAEAIDSVLGQTYENFELIIIDDGSTDATPEIIDTYVSRDERIRVVHQENRKLPRSLSRGFREARGQYLTWTSDDNRMKPEFLKRMVDCLKRHPEWDLAYSNIDITGQDGEFLKGSSWYEGYQTPPGSAHIHLPPNQGELNIWPENYVGGGFLYRDRVAALLGDYNPHRFAVEDYDYWMLVNEFLTLRHTDFDEPLYDYRFHDTSLTAQAKELRLSEIQRDLLVFDDFRRDSGVSPLIWMVRDDVSPATENPYLAKILDRADQARHERLDIGSVDPSELPSLWFPAVYLEWSDDPAAAVVDRGALPRNCMTVLATGVGTALPPHMADCWDLCVTSARDTGLVWTEDRFQGWFGIADPQDAFTAIEIRARMHHWRAIENEIHCGKKPNLLASVVVCTYQRPQSLIDTLQSVASQTIPTSNYEVLLVNNDPDDDLSDIVENLRRTHYADDPERLRVVECPLRGLSHARNAGISEARGVVVCFTDDDAIVAPDWLETTLAAYEENPEAGVVGGKILLTVPDTVPPWFNPDAWRYWSYFPGKYESTTEVVDWWKFPWGANWTARRDILLRAGGFRHGYGRKGKDFGAGEEVIVASLARMLGSRVFVEPRSVVQHNVDPARFTKTDLRKLISAGLLTNYYMQRDLYTPAWQNLRNVTRDLLGHARMLVGFLGMTPFKRMETWYFLRGEMKLMKAILKTHLARLLHDF